MVAEDAAGEWVKSHPVVIFCCFSICLIRDKKGIILPSREASSAARGYSPENADDSRRMYLI